MTSAPRSALYRGELVHARTDDLARRAFRYGVYMAALDLDELDDLDARLRLFSRDRPNLFGFRDRDYTSATSPGATRPSADLRGELAALRAANGLTTPHTTRLVTNLRAFGYLFNPVSFALDYDATGAITSVIAEVNNTYGGSLRYVLGPAQRVAAADAGADVGADAGDRTSNAVDRTSNAGDHTSNAVDRSATAVDRTSNAVDRTSKTGDRTSTAVDRTSNAVDRSANAPDRSANAADRSANAGDRTSNAGDRTSNAGDRTSNAGGHTSNADDHTSNAGDHTSNAADRTSNAADRSANANAPHRHPAVTFRHVRELFVSPFLHGDVTYDFTFAAPLDGDALEIEMRVRDRAGHQVFFARFAGTRAPLTDRTLAHAALRYPFMTARVIALIHWQALKLRLAGVPYLRPRADHRPNPRPTRTS